MSLQLNMKCFFTLGLIIAHQSPKKGFLIELNASNGDVDVPIYRIA